MARFNLTCAIAILFIFSFIEDGTGARISRSPQFGPRGPPPPPPGRIIGLGRIGGPGGFGYRLNSGAYGGYNNGGLQYGNNVPPGGSISISKSISISSGGVSQSSAQSSSSGK